jgi:hypothetical protein
MFLTGFASLAAFDLVMPYKTRILFALRSQSAK